MTSGCVKAARFACSLWGCGDSHSRLEFFLGVSQVAARREASMQTRKGTPVSRHCRGGRTAQLGRCLAAEGQDCFRNCRAILSPYYTIYTLDCSQSPLASAFPRKNVTPLDLSWEGVCLSTAECKAKPLSLLGGLMRRTASLDAIYLSAQWPRDLHSYCGRPMVDRSTQTPDDWKELERIKFVQKKAALPQGDSLEMKYIRQRLQRTAQGGRTSPRWSPVQGDHQLGLAALSPPLSPSVAPPPPPSGPIPIQARPGRTPPGAPRMRNSVEGLNQEIERLVLKGISGSGTENEAELERVMGPTPEGHRAPIAELFHYTCSVDTQTPSGSDGSNGFVDGPSRHSSSRPDSLECDKSASPDLEVSGHTSKLGTSPQINKFLTREPPDGCEKVKIIDEGRKPATSPMMGDGTESVLKPSSQFVLRPSQSSAFCPLVRNPFQGVHRPGPIVDPFLLNERLQ
ncbi:protein FAM117B-like isoform X2 [Dermacentor albipictus]|uniref:protein FAM117B-like isoform X2 n=1 Tax=Dermacentor albipictus TaxID=60249 RepID=UPI0038FC21C2